MRKNLSFLSHQTRRYNYRHKYQRKRDAKPTAQPWPFESDKGQSDSNRRGYRVPDSRLPAEFGIETFKDEDRQEGGEKDGQGTSSVMNNPVNETRTFYTFIIRLD